MIDDKTNASERPGEDADDLAIDRPRLTPQGRTAPEAAGEDATDPKGKAKQGQTDKAEG